jgi:hypothetical protein
LGDDKAKSAEDWEKAEGEDSFITPLEYLVAEHRYYLEVDQHLKQEAEETKAEYRARQHLKGWTLCPGSRTADGKVPDLDFDPGHGRVGLYSSHPDSQPPRLGVRRVVSKEI